MSKIVWVFIISGVLLCQSLYADPAPLGSPSPAPSPSPSGLAPVLQTQLPNGEPLTQYALPNGLTLYVVENHSAPVFAYRTWYDVGVSDEALDPAIHATGLGNLLSYMMSRGTTKYPDGQFNQLLASAGVDFQGLQIGRDAAVYSESLPSAQLPLVMQLESDRMTNLTLDPKLFATEQNVDLNACAKAEDDPTQVGVATLYQAAFASYPYQFPVMGTAAQIQAFTPSELSHFYKKYYTPSNAAVLIVGDVIPSAALGLAQQYYGAIPAETVAHPAPSPEPAQTQGRTATFVDTQLQQTRVLVAFHVPGVTSPDFPALLTVQSALTNGDGSLLQTNWVNAGISINAFGHIDQTRAPGLFTLSADLETGNGPNNITNSLSQTLSTLAAGIDAATLARAQAQVSTIFQQPLTSNEGIADFLGGYVFTAGNPAFGFGLIAAVGQVVAADVTRVIGAYLQPTNMTVVVGQP